jgi:two-component system chemotaxis sensor kinase CheA
MTQEQDEFTEIRNAFLEEAEQLLAQAEQGFMDLEKRPEDVTILDSLFRLAHNLKGSGSAVGFMELGAFTHKLESLLLKLKEKVVPATPPVVDLLLRCNDQLKAFLDALKADHGAKVDSQALISEIEDTLAGKVPAVEASSAVLQTAAESSTTTPSITTPSLAGVEKHESEEPLAADLMAQAMAESVVALAPSTVEAGGGAPSLPSAHSSGESPAPVANVGAGVPQEGVPAPQSRASTPVDENVRVAASKISQLLNFVGEMVILQSVLQEQVKMPTAPKEGAVSSDGGSSNGNGASAAALLVTAHQMEKITKEIQALAMSMRMVPLKPLFQKLSRIVRDTAKGLDKTIQLETNGEETELDRTVLEQLGDPLVHMVRNAVDHGVESPAERIAAGKPATGQIKIKAYHKVGQIVIEVEDDGKGLDPQKLIQSAIKKGLLPKGKTLPDHEAFRLIFAPGFSTKEVVTSVSGRGVGMDVVRTNIEALKGAVHIDSTLGKGTRFQVVLPLTLAIIDSMVVRVGSERFVLPLHQIFETFHTRDVPRQALPSGEVAVLLRRENLPCYELRRLLGRPAPKLSSDDSKPGSKGEAQEDRVNLVIRTQQFTGAVEVDEILSQQQAVIKPLGPELGRLRGIKGSAILGDGCPSLILEIPELFEQFQKRRAA